MTPSSHSEKTEEIPSRAEDESDTKKAISCPAWIQAISAVLIVIITSFYTYYASVQATKMKEATEAAKKSADAAKKAADIAESALSQSKAALDQSIRASRTEQRAWIAITVTGHKLQVGSPISAAIRLQNLGKTPAKNYEGHVIVEVIHGDKQPRFVYKKYEKATGRVGGLVTIPVALPNAQMDADVPAGEVTPDGALRPSILRQSVLDEINSGKARLFVHGRGDFEDFFKVQHWITFCFVYLPTSPMSGRNFVNCQGHNDTDSNQD